MGFFSKLEKKKLTGEIVANLVLNASHYPDNFLRKFVYTSTICTNNFFDNFFENNQKFSHLKKYKNYLTKEKVRNVFKIFALYDFIDFNKGLKEKGFALDNEIEYQKQIELIFEVTDNDLNFFHTLNNVDILDFSPKFYYAILNKYLGIPIEINSNDIKAMDGLLFIRQGLFKEIITSKE